MFMFFCLIQFLERLRYFEEETERRRAELKETLDQETRELYEKKLAGQFKICDKMDEDAMDPMLGTVVKQIYRKLLLIDSTSGGEVEQCLYKSQMKRFVEIRAKLYF